jgi:hypothetical protein
VVGEFGTGRAGRRLRASARLFLAGILAASPLAAAAQAPARAPVVVQPIVPDDLILAKLAWTSIAAVDDANVTGDYSVLRQLGSPSFQQTNSIAALAASFQPLRAQQLDLGNAVLVSPVFEFPPAIVQNGLLRMRGSFPIRPTGIAFDLLFQYVGGRWRIFAIAVAAVATPPAISGSTRR